jgi:antirestriction protein ArdC
MSDQVTMPAKNLFVNDEAYYATLFHELAHNAA